MVRVPFLNSGKNTQNDLFTAGKKQSVETHSDVSLVKLGLADKYHQNVIFAKKLIHSTGHKAIFFI